MFEKITNWFSQKPKKEFSLIDSIEQNKPVLPKPKKSRKPKLKPVSDEPLILTPKEIATKNGEPYISITKVEIDEKDINNGSFELDWNDKFILNLIRAGYKIKKEDKDGDIVNRWFTTVCRNIALEVYEQDQADPTNRDIISDMRTIRSRDLGEGRTEVS